MYNAPTSSPSIWRKRFVGIADYENNPDGHPVVLKIETGTSQDYFLGFNRARGINRDNQQASNQVTIIQVSGNDGK